VLAIAIGSKILKNTTKNEKEAMWSHKNFKKSVQGTTTHKILSKTHDFVFSEGVQRDKIAQVMGGKQNSEGPKTQEKNDFRVQVCVFDFCCRPFAEICLPLQREACFQKARCHTKFTPKRSHCRSLGTG